MLNKLFQEKIFNFSQNVPFYTFQGAGPSYDPRDFICANCTNL